MSRFFTRFVTYPLYQVISGRRITPRLAELRQSQYWRPEQIRELQWDKLGRLLAEAYEANRFHRARFDSVGMHPRDVRSVEEFRRLPLLRKDDILRDPEALISDGYSPSNLHRDNTSGSTGKNLVFYIDRPCLDGRTAAVLRNMEWYGVRPGDTRIKLWGAPLGVQPLKRLIGTFRDFLLREHLVSSYELNPTTLARLADRVRRLRPKALVGYVSALEIFARFVELRGLEDVVAPAVIPAGETLFDHQRELFERAFRGKVFNRYGSHEFTGVAHECEAHGGMHINAENLIVEVVVEDRPARPGELGEIVITDLENRGMPFIRYGTEDLGELDETPCPCGRGLPRLARVEGRIYDVIVCPNGAVHTGTFFCKLTRSAPGIRQFQVIQETPLRLRIKMVTDSDYGEGSADYLVGTIRRYCGDEMQVELEPVEAIEPLPSGKLRYVVSLDAARSLPTLGGAATATRGRST